MHISTASRILSLLLLLTSLTLLQTNARAQSGTDFWFAPPDITDLHNVPGGEPLLLVLSSTGNASVVTISQPANAAFNGGSPIVVNVPANQSVKVNLTSLKSQLETRPTNTIVNTGLRIQSTATITCYYECANNNNTDIWALKGPNSLGTEFYIPLHKHAPFYNEPFASPHQAFASFDICATQNNTVVTIYSPTPLDGRPALQQFSITLNAGQTYSAGFTGTNHTQPSTHPSGAVVLADKPITVSLKDDSNHNPSGGCYDILGDQIVPVNVVGEDYIAVKGSLNATGDESVAIMATQNNTQVFVNGATTPVATLFAGEYYRLDMDYLSGSATENAMFIHCSKPAYAMHITGFGCEMGMAQLPPLNCAGSQTLNFTRGNSQAFYITLLCRAAAINSFTVTGPSAALINPSSFQTVPGTGGEWRAARIQYNTTEVPVDATFKVTNTADVFALGVVNGGASTGCKYGYFSEFVAPITVSANIDQTICANTSATLNGSIAGGTTTGEWTSTGTGSFTPNATALNAVYNPSPADAAAGSVTLTLTSTGACTPVSDQLVLTITPAPTVNAGANQTVCANNPNISLNGSVTVASGGIWTGGAGTFIPSNTALNAVYVPTSSEINSGSLALTLTTTGNGICNPIADNVLITFSPAPIVNAGVNQTKCANNAVVTLAGSITVASGGVWTGGLGSFNPSATTLNATYTPTPAEITSGSITLTLTSTGNGSCISVSDQMTISFTAPPTANAGSDIFRCANNASAQLSGSVTVASGAQWTGGLGTFSPNNNTLNATYNPTAAEIANGSLTLTLTTTGNASCSAVTDQVTIFFSPAPIVNAGSDLLSCANNSSVTLNGSVTIAGGAVWTGGNGVFSPNNTTLNATYTPTATEIATGQVTLILTSTGNGLCNEVSDQVLITISPAPVVNAGQNISACANNSIVNLSGQVFNATGAMWSGGAGTFFPNANTLNATYTPTVTEISSGSINLTLTSISANSCNTVSDDVLITFAPTPIVNAGVDQTVCGNNAVVTLNGFVNFALGGQWTGGLGIFTPSNTSLGATYSPTATEIANGFVNLTLTSSGNGSCIAVSDIVRINYTPAPTISIVGGVQPCTNNPSYQAAINFTVASGILWSGNGSFNPSNTSANITYTPTAEEITAGNFELSVVTTGNGNCIAVDDNISVEFINASIVNAGADQTVCVTSLDVSLSGSISGSANTGIWTSTGTGTFSPSNTALNAVYTCSAADSLAGSVQVTLTSTSANSCIDESDFMVISILPAGIANAGNDQTVCGNNATIELNGIISGAATSGMWTSSGTGSFSPDNNTTNATYIPSAFDIANGGVDLILTANSCNIAKDTLAILITPVRTISVGDDATYCADIETFDLSALIENGPQNLVWNTTGTGTISPNANAVNITYNPSAQDLVQQTITFTATTLNNGSCVPVSDQVVIELFPTGNVTAGLDQIVCANNANVALGGTISGGASAIVWTTSGTGLFVPNASDINATYVPSEQDILAGSVTLTIQATNSCNEAIDELVVTITPAPVVNAGANQTLCGSNPAFQLEGTASNVNGIIWTGGNGTFSPNNTTLDAVYIPTPTEQSFGSVTLTLSSTSNGNCTPVSDAVVLFMTSGIVVNAGQDQTVCSSTEFTQLNGGVSNGSSTGIWTTSGSGSFSPDNTSLNPMYTFSESDLLLSEIEFILTSTNNGNCPIESDTVIVIFGASAFSNAGLDLQICGNQQTVTLNGLVSGGASTGVWSTNGGGTFVDSNNLNTVYNISNSDILLGEFEIYLTTTNNGDCLAGVDTLEVLVTPVSVVTAGSDFTVCETETELSLGGSISGASSTGVWSSLGTGTFSSNTFGENITYSPSASDITQGSVEIILTSNDTGICPPSSDNVVITFSEVAIVAAGSDQLICSSENSVSLAGTVSSTNGTAIWTSSGTGLFDNNTTNATTYSPSNSDIAIGEVTLYFTSTNNGACEAAIDSLTISIVQAINVNAGSDQIICGDKNSVDINGLISGSASAGVWTTTGTGAFGASPTTLQNNYTLSASDISIGMVDIVLTSTNSGICPNDNDTLKIIVQPLPIAAFTSESDEELGVEFTDESIGAASWDWSFENGATSAVENPSVTFPEAGQYEVILIVTSTAGCSDTIVSVVQAFDKAMEPIDFPTAFSPNGDNSNDVLHVLGGPFEEVDFKIYNNWGNEIFSTTDPEGGWDGSYKGTQQPVGVYVYTVTGTTIDGKKIKLSGNVTLIR